MTHELTLRVHYEDTDMAGVVYYANYLKFIERGRSEALREAGVDQRAMREEGVVFVVTDVTAKYHSPARYDDELAVRTELGEVKRAWASLVQTVRRGDELLFSSTVRFACMTVEGRLLRLPEPAVAALNGLRSGD